MTRSVLIFCVRAAPSPTWLASVCRMNVCFHSGYVSIEVFVNSRFISSKAVWCISVYCYSAFLRVNLCNGAAILDTSFRKRRYQEISPINRCISLAFLGGLRFNIADVRRAKTEFALLRKSSSLYTVSIGGQGLWDGGRITVGLRRGTL